MEHVWAKWTFPFFLFNRGRSRHLLQIKCYCFKCYTQFNFSKVKQGTSDWVSSIWGISGCVHIGFDLGLPMEIHLKARVRQCAKHRDLRTAKWQFCYFNGYRETWLGGKNALRRWYIYIMGYRRQSPPISEAAVAPSELFLPFCLFSEVAFPTLTRLLSQ